MRAIVLDGVGGLESLVIKELPDPEPRAGHVLIAVKAFGVNQAQPHMRKGEWATEFPLSEVPLEEIVDRVAKGIYKVKPAAVFSFDEIREARRLMESNQANGKIIVKL
jgi:NADPH:quinone reductase